MSETASFPEGCPPDGHQPAEGTYYRLADARHAIGDLTCKGCWRKPYKVRGPMFGRVDDCHAHAISVFEDLAILRAARELSPWAAKKTIAEIKLMPEMGRTLETESKVAEGHHDWWTTPYELHPSVEVIEGGLEVAS